MELRSGIVLLLSIVNQVKAQPPLGLLPIGPSLPRPPDIPLPSEIFGPLAPLNQPATYIAILPQYVSPNTDLSIPVTLLQPTAQETVTALLLDSNNRTLAEDTVRTLGKPEVTLNLRAPDIVSWDAYRVNITGTGSINFFNSTRVWRRHKSISVFVQTDKRKYKPGDTVKYRIFAINGDMDPVSVLMDVNFYDPKGNKMDEVTGVSTGADGLQVVDGTFKLSDLLPLGQWRIEVDPKEYGRSQTNYYFYVEEYELPRFEVSVQLPSFAKQDDAFLTGTVSARYTFGKPVQGYLVLTATRPWGRGFFDPSAVQLEMPIDGELTFNFPRKYIKRLTRNFNYNSVSIVANVTESISGITLAGSSNVQYHEKPYRIFFHPRLPDNFKPPFNTYTVVAKITTQDERPPVGILDPMKFTVTYYTDKPKAGGMPVPAKNSDYKVVSPFLEGDTIMLDEMSYPIGDDGMVTFDLIIPTNVATGTIKAQFRDQQVYKEISRFRSPSDVYLKAEGSGPLSVGDSAIFRLSSSEVPAQGKYLIVARNKIVKTGKFALTGPSMDTSVTVPITRDMAPSARFVAYFIRSDDEIVADGLNFAVDDFYQNKVSIAFDQTNNVEPKTNVNLRVTADKGSMVSVLAYDRSVRLLKDGNDITRDRVENELNLYGDTPYIARGWGPVMPWPIRSDDSFDVFEASQLKVLTDANLYKFNLWDLKTPKFQARMGGFRGGAMMMADGEMAAAPGGGAGGPTGQIRKEFPESWIWRSSIAAPNGVVDISAKVPDTLTTWEANAFALNPSSGLGVAPVTSNLTAFLPFFVAMQMPYSVIRGEVAVIQANVFNYHPEDLQVLVTLRGSGDFVGIRTDSNGQETELTGDITRCLLVKSGKTTPVFFPVRSSIIGPLTINVRIDEQKQRNIFDEIFRSLNVKAEGEEKEMNFPYLISNNGSDAHFTSETPIIYPPTTVPDSERLMVTVIGDIFGPSLKNLDTLVDMPYGCGEQNMLHFAPAVFAAVYMKATYRFDDNSELKKKIVKALKDGYQREIVYQRRDGSFSAFGDADEEGSLWLTAFVVKSFAQAHKLDLIFIDDKVVERAVRYITRYQTADGNFVNTGELSHKAMQGATASSERSLTAYVLTSLQEVKTSGILKDKIPIQANLTSAMDKAMTYLDERIFLPITDYEGAIVSYALEYGKSPMFAAFLGRLEDSAHKVEEDTSKYWKNPSHAMEIEIASYALLTYTLKKDLHNGMLILKWLVKQRNSHGGFVSTQDTVVALQALSEFAKLIYSKNIKMTIDIQTFKRGAKNSTKTLKLNKNNHDVLQYVDFDGDVDSVKLDAKGPGLAVVEIHALHNAKTEQEPPSYELRLRPYKELESSFMLQACTRFLIPNSKSNMAIMSVGAPSGYEALKEGVEGHDLVKRAETAGGQLVIYFNDIPTSEVCLDIKMQRTSIVLGVKPAPVLVYSYYEPRERVLVNYLPDSLKHKTDICSLCGKHQTSEMCSSCVQGGNTKVLPMNDCVPTIVPSG